MEILKMNRLAYYLTSGFALGVLLAGMLQPTWEGVSNYMLVSALLFLIAMFFGSGDDNGSEGQLV